MELTLSNFSRSAFFLHIKKKNCARFRQGKSFLRAMPKRLTGVVAITVAGIKDEPSRYSRPYIMSETLGYRLINTQIYASDLSRLSPSCNHYLLNVDLLRKELRKVFHLPFCHEKLLKTATPFVLVCH